MTAITAWREFQGVTITKHESGEADTEHTADKGFLLRITTATAFGEGLD
ncbi:MAG: hypothetical protein QOD35_1212, partial [Nocardioidaceae bacterium]|nr:hypothetical protein [Nocardioidaceae bacterium]